MKKISDILGDCFWYDMNFKEAVIAIIIYWSVAYILVINPNLMKTSKEVNKERQLSLSLVCVCVCVGM